MKSLQPDDLDALAIGCSLLGSGGGGDPAYELMMAKHLIKKPYPLIELGDLNDDDIIIPVGFMGAPLVIKEKLQSGREFTSVMKVFKERTGMTPTVIAPVEIGGSNGITPLLAAFQMGLPLFDGDLIGRAFPKLEMCTGNVFSLPHAPAVFADSMGNSVVIDAKSIFELEHLARNLAVAMGSSLALGIYPMTSQQAQEAAITGTVSQALDLGKAVIDARKQNKNPVQALLDASQGRLIGMGAIIDIDQRVDKGFLEGTVRIGDITVLYQNEYLAVLEGDSVLASTPDIIALVDQETGEPLTSEILRYGIRVALVAIQAPAVWTTKRGLELTGPRYFGYDFDYKGTTL